MKKFTKHDQLIILMILYEYTQEVMWNCAKI